jgi:hypothetical protein
MSAVLKTQRFLRGVTSRMTCEGLPQVLSTGMWMAYSICRTLFRRHSATRCRIRGKRATTRPTALRAPFRRWFLASGRGLCLDQLQRLFAFPLKKSSTGPKNGLQNAIAKRAGRDRARVRPTTMGAGNRIFANILCRLSGFWATMDTGKLAKSAFEYPSDDLEPDIRPIFRCTRARTGMLEEGLAEWKFLCWALSIRTLPTCICHADDMLTRVQNTMLFQMVFVLLIDAHAPCMHASTRTHPPKHTIDTCVFL